MKKQFCSLYIFFISVLLQPAPSMAQVVPDSTLGAERSIVEPGNQYSDFLVRGGALRGETLFHSFSELSIPGGKSLYFTNPGVQQIVTRITGNLPSEINGRLGILGSGSLYLLNPNGIFFGANSSLDIRGSLILTTGKSFDFANNSFGTINPTAPPLIAVGAPTAINFDSRPGSIVIRGNGGTVTQGARTFEPADTRSLPTGLEVTPGQTFALIGGNINLSGAVITAPSGNIEFISLNSGKVIIDKSPQALKFQLLVGADLADINLSQSSILNASGMGSGFINLYGNNVSFRDSSLALIENQGFSDGGLINIKAQGNLTFVNDTALSRPLLPGQLTNFGGILSQTYLGNGASVLIEAGNFDNINNGIIYVTSFGSGTTGAINIKLKSKLNMQTEPNFIRPIPNGSVISTFALGSGGSGDINISTSILNMQNSSTIVSSTIGNGNGGNVTIKASKEIRLSGLNPFSFYPTLLSTATVGSAQGGNLTLTTPNLYMEGGSRIDASALQEGRSGNIVIRANQIEIAGLGFNNPTLITSSASQLDPVLASTLGLSLGEQATAGSIRIFSQNMIVRNNAQIKVTNDTTRGEAGVLGINSQNLFVNSGSRVSASTNGGNGGNINLNVQDLLFLDQGQITAAATGSGLGGNVNINTGILLAGNNSLISANAQRAQAGQVAINAQGLFTDSKSFITANSELGRQFNGVVSIISGDTDFNRLNIPTPNIRPPEIQAICNPHNSGSISVQAFGGQLVPIAAPQASSSSWRPGGDQLGQSNPLSQSSTPSVTWVTNTDGTISFIGGEDYISRLRNTYCSSQKTSIQPESQNVVAKSVP